LIDSFPQGFSGLEVGNPFFRDFHAFTTARVSAQPGRPSVDGKTAKPANLDSVATNQSFIHRIKNRLDGKFGIAMCQLDETVCKFFNKVRAGHGMSLQNEKRPAHCAPAAFGTHSTSDAGQQSIVVVQLGAQQSTQTGGTGVFTGRRLTQRGHGFILISRIFGFD